MLDLDFCYGIIRYSDAEFQNFNDLRQTFSSADLVGNFTVFNIGGNNYRLITYIIIFIRAVLTHSEYDKENWKNDDWFHNS